MRYEALPVAAGDATCALIVALDVINLEKGATAPGETTPNAVQECGRCPDRKLGRLGLCLRAPVDAPKLEWIAPAFPKPGGPFGPAFLITTGKWPRSDDSFIPISGEALGPPS